MLVLHPRTSPARPRLIHIARGSRREDRHVRPVVSPDGSALPLVLPPEVLAHGWPNFWPAVLAARSQMRTPAHRSGSCGVGYADLEDERSKEMAMTIGGLGSNAGCRLVLGALVVVAAACSS